MHNVLRAAAKAVAASVIAGALAVEAKPIAVAIDGNDVVARVPAGTLDETAALHLVWDDEDRGTNLADWPVANRVRRDVGCDGARPFQYRFNCGKIAQGRVFRVLATSRVRPLENGYIYIGNNQYVDTGVKATQVYGLAIRFQYSPNDYQKAWASLMGSLPTFDFTIGRRATGSDGQFYLRYRGESLKADGKTADLMFSLGDLSVPHAITIANRTATLDGAMVMKDMPAGSIGTNTDAGTILLGCSWDDDCSRSLSGRYCHAKWYSMRLDDANGKAIMNLVPATRGGEGVLWDTVSRKVFANAGTGALAFSGKAGAPIDGTEAVSAASCAVVAGNTEFVGKARFTLLTDRMIRCEWSEDGYFEDRPSITFVKRVMPPVKHTLTLKGEGVVIETDGMKLEWTGGAFNESNLVVSVANVEMLPMASSNVANEREKPNRKLGIGTGNIGNNGNIKNEMTPVAVLAEDKENLLGTMRTIDARTSIKDLLPRMEKGIVSRRGVTVVDDTTKPLFVKGGEYWKTWVEERPRRGTGNGERGTGDGAYRDLVVFAYGHDYKGCLGDYVKVAGRIPLPPRWAFGYWWSRFWNDSESDYRQIVREMKSVGIPMDVCVIELYWHENWNIADRPDFYQPQDRQLWGWGGYTWNRRYFPDPARIFRFLHGEGLRAPLNMHPASGIPECEDVYPRFAKDYGWKGKGTIPFRGDEERWAEVYFKDVIEPLEALGADFFWLDWQQWRMAKGKPTLSNTFWLNHLFATHDASRRGGAKRPIIYHRWGGLGSHRYQIGFSGDGECSWRMLEAIPWFTATASNVGYGYWGHDLGGHMNPNGEYWENGNGQLFTRWMQCGVFMPIFRTHPTKDSRLERRPWKYADHFFILREAYRLRYRLAPYIYTAARKAYDTGVCLCRPMYYDWPEDDAAYEAANQYMFGDDILVAPVTKPVDPVTKEAEVAVWLPKGTWYDVSKGEIVEGGRKLKRGYTIEETPWFAKAGAVIPMYPDSVNRLGDPGTDDIVLFCAPGGPSSVSAKDGTAPVPPVTSIYEDDGDNADYAANFRRTAIDREGTRVTIAPRKGSYTLTFPLAAVPSAVKVNGKECAYEYDAEDMAVVVKTPPQDGTHETVVELVYPKQGSMTACELSGQKGEHTRIAALTEDFRAAIANLRRGPGYRGWPRAAANLPTSWQIVWKTRDAIAAHPADAEKLLAERATAVKEFAEKDLPRLEKTLLPEFVRRLRAWLEAFKGVPFPDAHDIISSQ
jgi:alpha-glucosidase